MCATLPGMKVALALALLTSIAHADPSPSPLAHDIYKELVEINTTPSFTGMVHKPTASAIVASDARVYVRPELSVKLYGVIGPHASVTPSLDAMVTAVPSPSVALQGCIAGQIGVSAKIFGISLGDLSHDFPEQCIPLPIP